MAVNTFVKDCVDPNPLIRALAVRTMGCIRVDKITECALARLPAYLPANMSLNASANAVTALVAGASSPACVPARSRSIMLS